MSAWGLLSWFCDIEISMVKPRPGSKTIAPDSMAMVFNQKIVGHSGRR